MRLHNIETELISHEIRFFHINIRMIIDQFCQGKSSKIDIDVRKTCRESALFLLQRLIEVSRLSKRKKYIINKRLTNETGPKNGLFDEYSASNNKCSTRERSLTEWA